MPLGTMTAPVFWHSQESQPQAHKVSDVKSSDRKARVLLRRLRTGSSKKTLVVVPSITTTTATPTTESQLVQPQQQEENETTTTPASSSEETIERPATSTPSLLTPSEAETATTADDPPEELPVLPAYVARPGAHEQPPPYAGQILPPALPGYTALPLPGTTAPSSSPARDLKQPSALLSGQRRYRNVLRRRISATKRLFGVDSGPETAAAAESEDPSARGVVMYRDRHDRWVGADEMDEIDELKYMQARQTGVKGWLKKVWAAVKDFMEEHPMLFFVALFVIIVVALCILI